MAVPMSTQSHPHRGRSATACRLLLLPAAAFSILFVVFLASSPTSPTRRPVVVPPRRWPATTTLRSLRAIHDSPPLEVELDAVLLPDWEVLLLVLHHDDSSNATTCEFQGGASSPARKLGRVPSSGRLAYTCIMPMPARRRQPFRAPRLITTSSSSSLGPAETMMLRWSGRLVYHAVALHGGDVLVFAKGVNQRQGVNRNATDVRCIYYRRSAIIDDDDGELLASLPAATSAQQVFRCPPPPTTTSAEELRVTLAIAGEDPIPSMATYHVPLQQQQPEEERLTTMMCASTMVRDVAKFLREWVVYHAAVGVDRFFILDNGSEDDLAGQVTQLRSIGFDVSTQAWPWPKTQEAGFSYAAAVHRASCEWMAFVDMDEFIFSSGWAKSRKPTKSMLRSVVALEPDDVGQVTLGCTDFGPSGRTRHPEEGVTQGYTCRRRAEERHKSLVRLDSVDPTLLNSIHHFELQSRFKWKRSRKARVNHYKYQAWDEFKVKFRRRVSTYVVDWTDPVNAGSKDRTPGLGFEPVEPDGWKHKFCEVEDTLLRNVTRRWFGVGFTNNYISL